MGWHKLNGDPTTARDANGGKGARGGADFMGQTKLPKGDADNRQHRKDAEKDSHGLPSL